MAQQTDASALEEVLGQEAALADSTVEGLYTNLVKAEPDGPGPRVRLAPGFEVRVHLPRVCLCRLVGWSWAWCSGLVGDSS